MNDGKHQVLVLAIHGRRASEATRSSATAVAKDPGVSHYGCGSAHPEMDKKLDMLMKRARRIHIQDAFWL